MASTRHRPNLFANHEHINHLMPSQGEIMKTLSKITGPRMRLSGFTLTEIMVTMGVFSLVMAAAVPTFIMCQRSWAMTSAELEATQEASTALARMTYGVGAQYGLRSALASNVFLQTHSDGWTVTYKDISGASNMFAYSRSARRVIYDGSATTGSVVIARNIVSATASNSGAGIYLSATCLYSEGRFSSSNTMSTFVAFRN